jgi:hypothetical protein
MKTFHHSGFSCHGLDMIDPPKKSVPGRRDGDSGKWGNLADQGTRRPLGQNAWGLLGHQASSWKAGLDREKLEQEKPAQASPDHAGREDMKRLRFLHVLFCQGEILD